MSEASAASRKRDDAESVEDELSSVLYRRDGRIARIVLNRPKQGNGITLDLAHELSYCVERANLDPSIHVIALSGNGRGFCGGYDFTQAATSLTGHAGGNGDARAIEGSPLDIGVVGANHDPNGTWDPVVDFQMMWRNVRGFMSLFHSEKPVICKVHGFCVAGGTDLALCADLMVVSDDAKIGYPPARVWGSPTSALWAARLGPMRAKRLLLTGDCLSGQEAAEWGLATESAPAEALDERFETLLGRVARVPINQLVMQKLLINQALYAQGLHATQVLGTFFDGIARHTSEGYQFMMDVAERGWREAVRERDEPFGDHGSSTFKG
jgi:enoyl-CoA hydratase/carnithine racemase